MKYQKKKKKKKKHGGNKRVTSVVVYSDANISSGFASAGRNYREFLHLQLVDMWLPSSSQTCGMFVQSIPEIKIWDWTHAAIKKTQNKTTQNKQKKNPSENTDRLRDCKPQ